jgi:penicillin-binding protein A
VREFTTAWEQGDYARMYADLTARTRRRLPVTAFADAYRASLTVATATGLTAGRPRRTGGAFRVPITVTTRIFGTIQADLVVPVEGTGDQTRIAWRPNLTFPGVPPGATLSRRTELPSRAAILARDRTPLAQGPDRTSPRGALASSVVGSLGPIPADRARQLEALGYPEDARVGLSGLERVFETRLAGTPGGQLLAGDAVLAHSLPRPAHDVRTTISPSVQQAAVQALTGRLGGVVAVRPRDGQILAVAGIGFSGLQPPGSTFKILTLTGVLEHHVAKPGTAFPYETSAKIEGVQLDNANQESCGGTLTQSFANSCNSVFAPLGAKLGAERLVDVAERFGFNHPSDIPGAAESTIPPAGEIGDDLAVGSSAIGQGRVQATALQMASVAATIALRGRRPRLTLAFDSRQRAAPTTRVTSPEVARQVERMMLDVVGYGTGTAAKIAGVKVAGKTGTAELESQKRCEPDPTDPLSCQGNQPDDPSNTDAWFASYAPAGRPRIAVAIMLVRAGAGATTAAPAARGVLLAGLKSGGQ